MRMVQPALLRPLRTSALKMSTVMSISTAKKLIEMKI